MILDSDQEEVLDQPGRERLALPGPRVELAAHGGCQRDDDGNLSDGVNCVRRPLLRGPQSRWRRRRGGPPA